MNFEFSLILFLGISFLFSSAQEQDNLGNCPTIPVTSNYSTPCSYNLEALAPRTCILDGGGFERCFHTYIPSSCGEENKAVPLVFDNHGFSSCPGLSSTYTGWLEKADDECFVLVWPYGTFDIETTDSSCFGVPGGFTLQDITSIDCCCVKNNIPQPIDDIPVLRSMIEFVVKDINNEANNKDDNSPKLSIDPKRIYMAGHSNGCNIALAMAARNSDVVAAVCCHAGTFISSFEQSDYNPVPIMMIHGMKDDVVPLDGIEFLPGLGFPSVLEGAKYLGNLNDCEGMAETDVENGEGTIYKYTNCSDSADVELVAIFEGVHFIYPGISNISVDTTSLAWEFCSSHAKREVPDVFLSSTLKPTMAEVTTQQPTSQQPTKIPGDKSSSSSSISSSSSSDDDKRSGKKLGKKGKKEPKSARRSGKRK